MLEMLKSLLKDIAIMLYGMEHAFAQTPPNNLSCTDARHKL